MSANCLCGEDCGGDCCPGRRQEFERECNVLKILCVVQVTKRTSPCRAPSAKSAFLGETQCLSGKTFRTKQAKAVATTQAKVANSFPIASLPLLHDSCPRNFSPSALITETALAEQLCFETLMSAGCCVWQLGDSLEVSWWRPRRTPSSANP